MVSFHVNILHFKQLRAILQYPGHLRREFLIKGKIVLELLNYAKSAIKNLDQSEATFRSHMTTMEASDWSKFFIADLAYMSNSENFLPLVKLSSGRYFNIFFSGN